MINKNYKNKTGNFFANQARYNTQNCIKFGVQIWSRSSKGGALQEIYLPAALRYSYSVSEVEFEIFRPAGATRCTDGW